MNDNIIQFPDIFVNRTSHQPRPAHLMLDELSRDEPAHAFVLVWPKGGGKPTYHCSTTDMPVVLMRLQEFIHKYYNGDFDRSDRGGNE